MRLIEKTMIPIKKCPDLKGFEEKQCMSHSPARSTLRVPFFELCVTDLCSAYKDGKCLKYNTIVAVEK